MNSPDNNKYFSGENRKPDILRAKDIFPPAAITNPENQTSNNTGDGLEDNFEIPKFDLAEQILAQQRKTSGTTRKSPAKKPPIPISQPTAGMPLQPVRRSNTFFSHNDIVIIKEVVARDIQQLCHRRKTAYQ
jgi:hypothetical protein